MKNNKKNKKEKKEKDNNKDKDSVYTGANLVDPGKGKMSCLVMKSWRIPHKDLRNSHLAMQNPQGSEPMKILRFEDSYVLLPFHRI